MHSFNHLHLAMFSGKGGVGKTTLSCGFARHWSQQFPGDRVLLISTDPAHSLGDVLQVAVDDTAHPLVDLPNLQVRALNAQSLLREFKAQYGKVLELLVERGSFVQGEDLSPVWDLSFPGLDELMAVLEIQRLLRDRIADRVVVDMAPSGHTLNLFKLMDFLDNFLGALDLFQEKHRVISQTFTGRYIEDEADQFLTEMKADLTSGRLLLQDAEQTACFVVAIAEPLSLLETTRFLDALQTLQIPLGGIWVNHLLEADSSQADETWSRYAQQQKLLEQFLDLAITHPVFGVPQQVKEPVGAIALDRLMQQASVVTGDALKHPTLNIAVEFPAKISPVFDDFIQAGRRLVLVGGKGGVGKTTVAAAIAWGMATQHGDRNVRVISIDPAHSLGDALGRSLGHNPQWLMPNLSAQEIDAEEVLTQFREEYLWELAEMMSGDNQEDTSLSIAYGPEAWRQIVSQSLPGIDEMLSLLTIMELLEKNEQDLIVLDTAPTGHLLRFLEMPTALGDWLAWIFKLWIKYQDVVGRTEFMGRLRTLRQRVMQAQKKLKDAQHTEFIGVMQAQSAILAEATRLTETLSDMGISQRYVVQNRFEAGQETVSDRFPHQTVVRLPVLPVAIAPQDQIKAAAQCLF
ncbi:ArsA family ATPase [Oscillatoria sp. FACHB-1407]|uniref:ArsA family ATPase n=1 Tax=Oscillatoria sp. FACHB-1407 TaxID=2692847 RepID=UPI0018F02CEF|nr:ArsA family ATPase [Oscillatoria sp. FACHB-1407]